jgi:hypothetical protein
MGKVKRVLRIDINTEITVYEDGLWVDGINTSKDSHDQVWIPLTDATSEKLVGAIQNRKGRGD